MKFMVQILIEFPEDMSEAEVDEALSNLDITTPACVLNSAEVINYNAV